MIRSRSKEWIRGRVVYQATTNPQQHGNRWTTTTATFVSKKKIPSSSSSTYHYYASSNRLNVMKQQQQQQRQQRHGMWTYCPHGSSQLVTTLSSLSSLSSWSCWLEWYCRSLLSDRADDESKRRRALQNESALVLGTSVVEVKDSFYVWKRFRSWLEWIVFECWNIVSLTIRSTEIILRIAPLAISTPAAILLDPYYKTVLGWSRNRVSDWSWWYCRVAMQALGPCFVKLCQWIATRRDLVPPHVCDRLSHLQDQGIPHSNHHTRQALQQAFGGRDKDNQLLLQTQLQLETIIGCGSAAQVYRARLKQTKQQKQISPSQKLPSSSSSSSSHTSSSKDDNPGEEEDEEEEIMVAVKVLHPNMEYLVERDLWLMDTIARWLHSLPFDVIRMANLPRAASNFGNTLRNQSDLTMEAKNLQQFRANFYRSSQQDEEQSSILFPRPIPGWISRQVLVEELYNMDPHHHHNDNNTTTTTMTTTVRPISSFLRDDSEQGHATRKELGSILLRAFLKMVFLDNFVHADLHPGNCLVVTQHIPIIDHDHESSSSSKIMMMIQSSLPTWMWNTWFGKSGRGGVLPSQEGTTSMPQPAMIRHKIVFLDAGIASSLSPNDQRNLRDLFRAVLLNQGYEAGCLMVRRAKYERCSQAPGGVEAFARGIQTVVAEFHDNRKHGGLSLGAVRIGSLLGRVLDLCRVHGVEIDPAMASVVISTLVLEGLGRSLDPNLNLLDFAVPFVLGRGRV